LLRSEVLLFRVGRVGLGGVILWNILDGLGGLGVLRRLARSWSAFKRETRLPVRLSMA
jgi:hypothetical protein